MIAIKAVALEFFFSLASFACLFMRFYSMAFGSNKHDRNPPVHRSSEMRMLLVYNVLDALERYVRTVYYMTIFQPLLTRYETLSIPVSKKVVSAH